MVTLFHQLLVLYTSIFPTKHALGLVTDNGLEVLFTSDLDTVSLEGKPFTVKVSEGQTVAAGDLLVKQTWMLSVKQVVKHQQLLSLQNGDAIQNQLN